MKESDTYKVAVNRIDSIPMPEWMTKTFQRTPEGFLKGRAIVTSVGVFPYQEADGKIHWELRLPEEVFEVESLESLKLKPVTMDHPGEVVTSQNVKEYQVGSLGNNPSSDTQIRTYDGYTPSDKLTDGFHLAIDLIITEEDAINQVLNGKQALSNGYMCDLEIAESNAVWCGVPYDFIQRKIRYNHVAVVDRGRAGDAAKIRLDSANTAVLVNSTREDFMGYKKITLDGVEYEAEAPVIVALAKAKERADAAEALVSETNKGKSTLEAERDSHKDRADQLQKDVDKLKAEAVDETKLDAAVNERLRIREAAKKAGIEKLDQKYDDLKKVVVLKAFPNAKLDGKDAAYISARFDAAVEMLEEADNQDASSRGLLGGNSLGSDGNSSSANNDGAEYNAEVARKRMIERMQKRSESK